MQSTVQIPIGKNFESLLVPRDAIVIRNFEKGVYKIINDTVKYIPIQIIGYSGGNIAIKSNIIEVGDNVVIKGNDKVKDGSKIQIVAK